MTAGNWLRVSPEHPCLTCGKSDWCLIAKDGTASLCQRISEGAVRRCGDAGWLHRHRSGLEHQLWATKRFSVPVERPALREDLANLNAEFQAAVDPRQLDRLAADLGLSVPSLQRLGIGWCARSSAWSFPMTHPAGQLMGIRLRASNGQKFAVRGSRDGLFVPSDIDLNAGRLLVCEGPTDTCAMLDLGFDHVVGRPSCRGGTALLVDLVRRLRPDEVVIVADNDEPKPDGSRPGQDGARMLAARLTTRCRNLQVIMPPPNVKDARRWKQLGADRENILAAIRAAEPHRISVRLKPAPSPAGVGEVDGVR